MPKIAYTTKALREVALYQIELANQIIVEYQTLDMTLTLRQVYYQMVARNLFPDDRRWRWTGSKWIRDPKGTKNAEPNYKWLQGLLDDGRMTGLVDWSAIEDRTRFMRAVADLIESAVTEVRDEDAWDEAVVREQEDRRHLRIISQHFDQIAEWVEDQGFSDETGEEGRVSQTNGLGSDFAPNRAI